MSDLVERYRAAARTPGLIRPNGRHRGELVEVMTDTPQNFSYVGRDGKVRPVPHHELERLDDEEVESIREWRKADGGV